MEREQRKRSEAGQGGAAAPPESVSPEEVQRRIAGLKADLFANAVTAIGESLDQHKRRHSFDHIEQATIAAAIVAFAHFLNGNKRIVPAPDTDFLINLGVDAVSAAAVEARRRAEEKRIILLK